MNPISKSLSRLRSLFSKRPLDSDLDAELRAHLDLQTQENIASGMSPEEARAAQVNPIVALRQE